MLEIAVVKPGERIPMDGEITRGATTVNEAPITGESMPVEKSPGDLVYAGTLNGAGAIEIRVSHVFRETTLARIIHRVEEAQAQRAPAQQIIDRFASRYTPAVVILALVVALVPPLWLSGWSYLHGAVLLRYVWTDWLVRGLS